MFINSCSQTPKPAQCMYCKRYLPKDSPVRMYNNMCLCPDHKHTSCSPSATESFTHGNFSFTFDANSVNFSFAKGVVLECDDCEAICCRTPIVMISPQQCFQIEVYWLQTDSDKNQNYSIYNVNDDAERVSFQFNVPNSFDSPPKQLPPLRKSSQFQISQSFNVTSADKIQINSYEIQLITAHQPLNDKCIYNPPSVTYVLRADLAHHLRQCYPETSCITQEFSALLFKAQAQQVARLIQFDGQGASIVSSDHDGSQKNSENEPFDVNNNDTFDISTQKLSERTPLLYLHAPAEGEAIGSLKRKERQSSVFLRSYLCMNQLMARYAYQQYYLQQLDGNKKLLKSCEYKLLDTQKSKAPLLIPTGIVPSKVMFELFSKFTVAAEAFTVTWDWKKNFASTYIRFLDASSGIMPEIISKMSVQNKQMGLRLQRRERKATDPPSFAQSCMLIDMAQFYDMINSKEEDKKLAGTSGHVILEPLWQNTYVSCRVSYPSTYKFDAQTSIDLSRGQQKSQQAGIVIGEATAYFEQTLFQQQEPGDYFAFKCFDALVGDPQTIEIDDLVFEENVQPGLSLHQSQDLTKPYNLAQQSNPRYLQLNTKNLQLDEFQTRVFLEDFEQLDFPKLFKLVQKNANAALLANALGSAAYTMDQKLAREEVQVMKPEDLAQIEGEHVEEPAVEEEEASYSPSSHGSILASKSDSVYEVPEDATEEDVDEPVSSKKVVVSETFDSESETEEEPEPEIDYSYSDE